MIEHITSPPGRQDSHAVPSADSPHGAPAGGGPIPPYPIPSPAECVELRRYLRRTRHLTPTRERAITLLRLGLVKEVRW